MFAETPLVRRKQRQETFAKWVFCAMAASMIVPLILIVGYLVERAWPALSLSFLIDVPVRGMKEGGIRNLIIPPAAGYGAEGDDTIPPNSTLMFEVELLKVR